MIFTESLWGTVTVEFTSAEPEKTLEEIMVSGITISRITKQSDLVFLFRIKQKDFHSVSDILKKRGDKLHILNRQGVFWHLKSIFRRPILVWIALMLLALTSYLPTRVLFIETEGNQTLSSEEILAAAEQWVFHLALPANIFAVRKPKTSCYPYCRNYSGQVSTLRGAAQSYLSENAQKHQFLIQRVS